jgi:hypothetical protein
MSARPVISIPFLRCKAAESSLRKWRTCVCRLAYDAKRVSYPAL